MMKQQKQKSHLPKPKKNLPKQPFATHLAELRGRLLFIFIIFLLGSIAGYVVAKELLAFLLVPLKQTVYYTSPTGGFNAIMTVSFLSGLICTIPFSVYQIFAFTKPLLSAHIQQSVTRLIATSFVLLCIGMSFAYWVILPTSLHFFGTFQTQGVNSLINVNDYISFSAKYLLGFGLVFQLPLVVFFVNFLFPLSPKHFFAFQRYIIVSSFLVGMILSPDPFTMVIVAGPIILLYYLSFLFLFIRR